MKYSDLFNQYRKFSDDVDEAIRDLIKGHGLNSVDLTVDANGRTEDNPDYTEPWCWDDRVWHTCTAKHGVVDGWVSKVYFDNFDRIVCDCKGEDDWEYEYEYLEIGDRLALLDTLEVFFETIYPLTLTDK